jgi:hypothetical protein
MTNNNKTQMNWLHYNNINKKKRVFKISLWQDSRQIKAAESGIGIGNIAYNAWTVGN